MPNENDKIKIVVTKEREVNTYTEMWHTSYCLLQKGLEQRKGSFHQYMASLVFTAFALEAYLNHIGSKIFSCWKDLERLSPKEKLNVIAERLKVKIDYGKRPWQVMKNLFEFRNDIAHGKSMKIKTNEILKVDNYEDNVRKFIQTRWEKYCSRKNAEGAREDVNNIVVALHKAAGFKDFPFVMGFQTSHESMLDK